MIERFRQGEPNMVENWEWKLIKAREGFTTCKKCGYKKAILQAGSIYCNECGIIEDLFAEVNLKCKGRQQG